MLNRCVCVCVCVCVVVVVVEWGVIFFKVIIIFSADSLFLLYTCAPGLFPLLQPNSYLGLVFRSCSPFMQSLGLLWLSLFWQVRGGYVIRDTFWDPCMSFHAVNWMDDNPIWLWCSPRTSGSVPTVNS